ncbi:hypothetical protein HK098_006282 [Nowakowskiella sp. JEL0407]|nr:hypothetical protein HK098_006282 [Nowakowskiella sp. JEL0407]
MEKSRSRSGSLIPGKLTRAKSASQKNVKLIGSSLAAIPSELEKLSTPSIPEIQPPKQDDKKTIEAAELVEKESGDVVDVKVSLTVEEMEELERERKVEVERKEMERRVQGLPVPFEVLKRGLSNMGPSSVDGLRQVYLKLSLPSENLKSIEFIKNYPCLQILELSGNEIEDISILGNNRYLTRIDLSQNNLSETLSFDPPPFNIQEVDLSRNKITRISDLSVHRFLQRLCLDDNSITEINGLSQCMHLTYLSLSRNSISKIEGLDNLPLKYLDVQSNKLTSLSGTQSLHFLETLIASNNAITTLSPEINLKNHPCLQSLNLENNLISAPEEISCLEDLPLLSNLNLFANPITLAALYQNNDLDDISIIRPITTCSITANPWTSRSSSPNSHYSHSKSTPTTPATLSTIAYKSYRLYIIFRLPTLHTLDNIPVSPELKISAMNLYNPPAEVVASMQHAVLTKNRMKVYAEVKGIELEMWERLRPVVVCGPSGVGKRTLISKLLNHHPTIFGYSISHTSRAPRHGEQSGKQYHFVSKQTMEDMLQNGEFVEIVTLFGNLYGTSVDSIEKVGKMGKVCVLDMEVEGVLALKKSRFNPRYVFIAPPSMESLHLRLLHKYNSTQHPVTDSLLPSAAERPETTNNETFKPSKLNETNGDSFDVQLKHLNDLDGPNSEGNADKYVQDEIKKWMNKAQSMQEYMTDSGFFDYVVVNDDLESSYQRFEDWSPIKNTNPAKKVCCDNFIPELALFGLVCGDPVGDDFDDAAGEEDPAGGLIVELVDPSEPVGMATFEPGGETHHALVGSEFPPIAQVVDVVTGALQLEQSAFEHIETWPSLSVHEA